eukprot:COSAG05_NODE_1531_length_4620_cov_3.897810_2_plen_85_part_00
MAKQLIDWNQTRPDILLWRHGERVTACVIVLLGAADDPDCEPMDALKANRRMHGRSDYRRLHIELAAMGGWNGLVFSGVCCYNI